jgi:hypothetical protein
MNNGLFMNDLEIPGLYHIFPLTVLRQTKGVYFDEIPLDLVGKIDAIDRVIHENGASSPGAVGDVSHPWYLHTHQDDHLLVMHGSRRVDLYRPEHGTMEQLIVMPHRIEKDGEVLYDGPAIIKWPRGVFHRVVSDLKLGSASLNLAVHYDGFDIRTNFSVYDLDVKTGAYRVIREGHLDQPHS